MLKGRAASEVEQVYLRAQELCRHTQDSPQHFLALVGSWQLALVRSQLHTARELGEQGFTLAQRLQDPALLWEAHLMLGSPLLYLGELGLARMHIERGLSLQVPRQSRFQAFNRGTDPEAYGLSHLAWALWTMGYPDRALTKSQEALALAQQLSHSYSLGHALHFASALHYWRREAQLVQTRAEAAIALSLEQGFGRWLEGGMMLRGWALADQGLAEEGTFHGSVIVVMLCKECHRRTFFFFNGLQDGITQAALLV